MIKFSIVVPFYNTHDLIERTLKSLLDQTYKKFECILINDCSTDNSEVYIKKLITNDNRFILYKNKSNLGAGKSRNVGLKNAKGQYVLFLDSDDWWDKDRLLCLSNYLKKNKLKKFLFSPCFHIYEDSNNIKIFDSDNIESFTYKDILLKKNKFCLSSIVIKRDIVKNMYFTSEKRGQDWEFWLNIAQKTKLYKIPDKHVYIYIRKNSLSSNKIGKILNIYNILNNQNINSWLIPLYLILHIVNTKINNWKAKKIIKFKQV